MKRFLACLALCASLSAVAQDDNCTVLGIQDLTQMVFELQTQLNAQDAAMTRDSVRAIARAEARVGASNGYEDLSGVNLSDANLSNAYLFDADLSGANLTGANLYFATLYGADLSGANLIYADLSGADLDAADLTDAAMTCLRNGCPSALPSGYICEPDTDCPDRYRIVPD